MRAGFTLLCWQKKSSPRGGTDCKPQLDRMEHGDPGLASGAIGHDGLDPNERMRQLRRHGR